ncbi:MAG: ligase-associated DNA damage response DEXH box helicase [Planctomycetota bacterium]
MNPVEAWFRERVGEPFAFQRSCWDAQLAGRSGLVHAPTGMGKTFSVWLPTLMRWCDEHPDRDAWATMDTVGPRVLWITPLRALATDTEENLLRPIRDLGLPWTVQRRTGDVSQAIKNQQRKRLPTCLVTTPESLSVLMSYTDAPKKFAGVQAVIVDEWHELMATKRGTQTELGLARLRAWNPQLQTWGLSATLGNLDEARDTLLGADAKRGELIHGPDHKDFALSTLLPESIERFPWAGHLGIKLLDAVIETIDQAGSTLVFTNTRSQAEIWFNQLQATKPGWVGQVALHHGSIERKTRKAIEDMLRAGELKCCVCTSSLDLGVDFSPVEQVIQIASPKGVARMLQRAGRSGHRPGAVSKLVGVPTNALEILDFAAARTAGQARDIESRAPLDRPLDVLVQHLVTCAMGGGFRRDAMLDEVRTTRAFRDLTDQEWTWCLDFVVRGGEPLKVYPQFARVSEIADEDGEPSGVFKVVSPRIAKFHRMAIGTITSDTAIVVKFQNGRSLGTVEESFVGFLKPKDKFVFAGHLLELVKVHQMTAVVKKAKGTKAQVPRWQGGRSPLSTQLANAVRAQLQAAREGRFDSEELRALRPLLELQAGWSAIPGTGELLIEAVRTRDGHHRFLYPLLGRTVHEGLGALIAYRLTQAEPRTVVVTVNDYGLELLSPEPFELDESALRELLTTQRLVEDLLACVDTGQLARRQFRDIARIAGLINTGYPGQSQSNRQLQASSELFFDVFKDFDPENLLLDQAKREVLERQLEVARLREALETLDQTKLVFREPGRLTPLGFPLWAERLREQHVTSQSWEQRIAKMLGTLEAEAGEGFGI